MGPRTIYGLFVLGLFTILYGSISIGVSFFDHSGRASHRVARAWARTLLFFFRIPVTVEGLGHIEPGKTYILAANHSSVFDIPVILAGVPLQFRWLAKAELFKTPLFGRALKAAGYIPIDRSTPRDWARSLSQAAERIREGASVVVFPEGSRSQDGELAPFKRGGFELAVRSGQPIAPVSISGTHGILPPKSLNPRPGPVKVVIDQPIPTAGVSRADQDQLMDQVRRRILANMDPAFIRRRIAD